MSASRRGQKRQKVADTSDGDRKIADGLTPNVVVEAIILGARTWAENRDAQMGWAENLERIKPKIEGHDLNPEALVAEYQKYTSATRWRWWQAMFITCCASVLAAATCKDSGRRKMSNNTVSASTGLRQRSMAKLLIAVMNCLAREAPEAAFNIIPALSGEYELEQQPLAMHTNSLACTSDLVVPQKFRGRRIDNSAPEIATSLLAHEDQRWRGIDPKYTFDPARLLSSNDEQ
ncbi:hypothetical protein LTS10_013339 [Elasticomyces elasticus]|nr:hypothetical protein LTS10_013339 [Elasticomyces elasticus]